MVVAAAGRWQGAHRNHNPFNRSPLCCLPIQGNQACYNRSGCHQKTAKNEVLFSEAAPHHLPSAPSLPPSDNSQPPEPLQRPNEQPAMGGLCQNYQTIHFDQLGQICETLLRSRRLKDWNYIRMRFKDYWHYCLKRYVLILGNRASNVIGLLTSPGQTCMSVL